MKYRQQSAFTIVELLIVIVVIGILAAIVIVAYNGVQERARASSASSALSQAAKKIAVWQVDYPSTSPTCTQFATELGSNDYDCSFTIGSINYQYTAGTNGAYCATATTGTTSYYINTTTATKPTAGGCAGHGVGGVSAVTNLEANPSFETTMMTSAGGGTGTRTQSVTQKVSGAYSTKCVWASAAWGVQTSLITVSASTTYALSLYVFVESGAIPSFSVAASDYATNVQPMSAVGSSGQWVRITKLYTTTASQTNLRIWTTVTSASTFYVDAVMINQGSTVSGYADGSSPNWVWNGTANNSTSTGPPL